MKIVFSKEGRHPETRKGVPVTCLWVHALYGGKARMKERAPVLSERKKGIGGKDDLKCKRANGRQVANEDFKQHDPPGLIHQQRVGKQVH